MLLGIRARTEALAAQQAAGVPIRPPSLRAVRWLPEPMEVAILRAMVPTASFEVGVAGHSRMARDEVPQLLDEYRGRIAPGGVPTPYLDAVTDHVEAAVPPLADGSRDAPLRWGGVAALGAGVTVPLAAGIALHRR